jgi:hypothetical protein
MNELVQIRKQFGFILRWSFLHLDSGERRGLAPGAVLHHG